MQTIFLELIKLSLIGSLFAGAVMLVRLIFPKTPKWIICLLWGVVALRLICPVSIESNVSLVPDSISSGQIITNIGDEYIGDVNVIYENNEEYSDAVEAGRQPIQSGDGYYVVTEADSLEAPKTVGETLYPILSWVWVAGVVLMLGYTVASYLMLRRKMAEATLLRDNIWQCEQVDSPFVLGFIKPRIYLPYVITEADMANVIAHEKAHIHRKDHWWKPVGFILLSLHWFNPILWLAYILLCRDIEAACDEKVIKHMEKDEKRAYSTALLNCSVNRRRIAACPLAFGEVGVKERVKTVMNYKKPAFWIVVTAVALCIVVAVCFLTNPKTNRFNVDNPALLEFPGIKWGMTPEEVKSALQLTEEQIYSEEYITLDVETPSGSIIATDLTFFDETVSVAAFQFRDSNKMGYKLFKIQLYLDNDADLDTLNANLTEVYGKDVGEYYSTYSAEAKNERWDDETGEYQRSGWEVKERKQSGDPKLWFLANINLDSEEGSLWTETAKKIIEDPNFKITNWISSTNTTKYFSRGDYKCLVNWFVKTSGGCPQDIAMEFLKKTPLVAMSVSNRSFAAAQAEWPEGVTGSLALATHNQVIFDADWLLVLEGWVERAKQEAADATPTEDDTIASGPEVDDPTMLEFPGAKWGMTIEEVKDSLRIKEDQILKDEQIVSSSGDKGYDEWELYVKDLTVFDSKVTLAMFTFISRTEEQIPEGREYLDHTGGEYVLQGVRVFLDEETDMVKLEQDMTGVYGDGVGGTYMYTEARSSGNPNKTSINANPQVRAVNQRGSAFQEALKDPNYQEQMWVCTDFMTTSANMRNYLTEMLTNNGHSEEDIREWLNQSPWITLRLVNNTYEAIRIESGDFKSAYTEYITRNSLEYRTSNDVCIAQYAARMESKVNDPSLLEFSGIKWGATPEEVKAALNLTDAQILRDEAVGDGWDLRIADVTFFGKEVSMGVFSFHRYGSNEFGLNSVNLFYPDETDMSVVNNSLAELYGSPKDSMGFTRYQVKQGKITPYTDAGITLVRYEGQKTQLINWWESTAKQADAFTAEVQEAIIASGILSSSGDRVDPADPSSRDVVLEFLAKEPAVFLFCTDSAKVGNPSSGYTKNVVSFDARDYRSQIEYHTKENESGSDTTTAIDPEVDELSTLCIPGIKWGATPEEVKTALSVTEEQIIGEGKSGNVWRLRVQNITLFGEKIAMGEFSFASFSDSSPYALMSIDLYYLAETDMNAIKDALINIYGAPKDGTGFTRYRIRQGEVEEYVSKGTDLGYYEGASRMISYWESTAKQINVLPADVQEKMATTGMVDVSGLGSGLDAGDPAALGIVQDYLQKEPAVLLYCTDSDEMGKYDAPYSRNRVSFNATNYIAMIQYHRK